MSETITPEIVLRWATAGLRTALQEERDPVAGWIEAEEALLQAFNGMATLAGADGKQVREFQEACSKAHYLFCEAIKAQGVTGLG